MPPYNSYVELLERIRKARQNSGFTNRTRVSKRELVVLTSYSVSAISNFLLGGLVPRYDSIVKIVERLGLESPSKAEYQHLIRNYYPGISPYDLANQSEPMYQNRKTFRTLKEGHMTEYLIQAQWAEMIELKKEIHGLAKQFGRELSVLDIGVGDGRVPKRLSGIREIWDLICEYDGIDNSQQVLKSQLFPVQPSGLEDKVLLFKFDARNLSRWGRKQYDLIVCTYFTAGNFIPPGFSFETGSDGMLKTIPSLDENPAFQQVFAEAYKFLIPGGKLILGSVYVDNDATRKRQEEFYQKCGMTVVTSPNASFTATKEGFWSQRFTKERIVEYLNFVPRERIELRPLDTYGFASMVTVTR